MPSSSVWDEHERQSTPEQQANEVVGRWLRDLRMSLYTAKAGLNALAVAHPATPDALTAIELSLELLDAIPITSAPTSSHAYAALNWRAPADDPDDLD